ncbi:MAG: peptidylprolyl isomerase [Anaeromyxobacter sp.]
MELPGGRVVIALAPDFAPRHVERILALVREGYFDGLSVYRVQDGYVAQWGDPDGDEPAKARPIKAGPAALPAEFTRAAADLPFTPLPDGDLYAPEVGFSAGFPAARDARTGEAWLTHCYGAVGLARADDPATGDGTNLFAVIGHAPRTLDRNITVVGRVVQGMEHLSSLPRGPAPMGFHEQPELRTPIRSVRVLADLPAAGRPQLELLRTEGTTWDRLVESRRNRGGTWYKVPAGRIDLCSVPLPVRPRADGQ